MLQALSYYIVGAIGDEAPHTAFVMDVITFESCSVLISLTLLPFTWNA